MNELAKQEDWSYLSGGSSARRTRKEEVIHLLQTAIGWEPMGSLNNDNMYIMPSFSLQYVYYALDDCSLAHSAQPAVTLSLGPPSFAVRPFPFKK